MDIYVIKVKVKEDEKILEFLFLEKKEADFFLVIMSLVGGVEILETYINETTSTKEMTEILKESFPKSSTMFDIIDKMVSKYDELETKLKKEKA